MVPDRQKVQTDACTHGQRKSISLRLRKGIKIGKISTKIHENGKIKAIFGLRIGQAVKKTKSNLCSTNVKQCNKTHDLI